jgi:hypothetical protein
MHKIATRTNSLTPKHTWVPWIVINGIYKDENQKKATTDLLSLICDMYKGQKPTECIAIE